MAAFHARMAARDLENNVESASSQPEPHAMLTRRNRDPGQPPPAQWNAVIATILDHRSQRHFLPRALPEGKLELLVAAAQSASTSSNLQFWSVVAVQEPAHKARLATLAGDQQFIRDAPLLLVWLADLARLDAIGAQAGTPAEGLDYLEPFLVGVVDAALAAQSALIAAESLRLGGVYVGAMRNLPEQVATELALPARVFAVFGMAIGWPDKAAGSDVKPRLSPPVVLHRERYQPEMPHAAVAAYDATMRDFQREQGMRAADWSRQSIARVKDAAALRGRDRLRTALRNLGFALR